MIIYLIRRNVNPNFTVNTLAYPLVLCYNNFYNKTISGRNKYMKAPIKLISLFLLASLTFTAVACAEKADAPATSVTTASDAAAVTEEEGETAIPYEYSGETYDGAAFRMLGQDSCNWANPLIVPEALNGELINDALYNRNKRVEDKLNVTISAILDTKDNIPNLVKKAVTAGDDSYDLAFYPNDVISSPITSDYFLDLNELEQLQLDKPWWDQIVIENSSIGDKLFFASSDTSLFVFEATWVIYFNESMMSDLSLAFPYDDVRAGSWTIDKLIEYCAAAANLNGADNFTYDKDGPAQYGIVTHSQFMQALLCGSEEMLIGFDEDNLPEFNGDNEHFYSVCSKIAELTSIKGQYSDRANMTLNNTEGSVSTEFKNGRFMFLSETLGHISNLRDFDRDFGVLPIPKYDENQEGYRSMIATWGVLLTTIPVTNLEYERTATVADMLAYESYISLMEPYYDTYLTQKGARNVDSAEMLAIVRETRELNIGRLYGWTTSLLDNVTNKLYVGNGDVASSVASMSKSLTKAIDKTLEKFS